MRSITPFRIAGCLALLGILAAPCLAASDPEDELKAAIVLSFIRYAEWTQPLSATTPISVGVIGRPAFAQTLRQTLEGKSAGQRAIKIVELKTAADPHCCQIIYFATGRSSDVKPALPAMQAAHVLTISDTNEFLEWGGDINLVVIDGRMSFEVNLEALERSGVTISSRLLRFGQIRSRGKRGRTS
jgi:hypothetical protein